MSGPVYFDHNATTPLDPRVLEAMLPFMREQFGNASSRHEYGRAARAAVDEARERVAAAVGAHPTEVLFTSGGTEANNLFIKGAAAGMRPGAAAISAIEHPSVREPARELAALGWRVREIAVDELGRIQFADYDATLAASPALVSVMLANNETGVLQAIPALASRARAAGAWFHTDAVQALGKVRLDFRSLGVHAMSLSGHKIHGPKGVGVLVVDKRVELRSIISGGGQERNLRSGTENVPAIVGFGAACEFAVASLDEAGQRLAALRGKIEAGVAALGGLVFSAGAPRVDNTLFFALPGIDGEMLVVKLDRAGFAVASGSACSSTSPEPSHVLAAMGVAPDMARGAVRVSLGRDNTEAQAEQFLAALQDVASKLKNMTAIAA